MQPLWIVRIINIKSIIMIQVLINHRNRNLIRIKINVNSLLEMMIVLFLKRIKECKL